MQIGNIKESNPSIVQHINRFYSEKMEEEKQEKQIFENEIK